jgi:O-antigen biosynthesis protein WbqP
VYRRFFKRALDLSAATLALCCVWPILLLVGCAIWIEDRGPAVFRQQRVGRDGAPFTIYKFRSMPLGTPNVPSADAATLRVTRVGRVIRRTNLDELPQLWNVLKGDMSLVGPRPALSSQDSLLALRRKEGVLEVRPGLTGLAQINAYDGMPETVKVAWETRYVGTISLVGDLWILLRTVGYLFHRPPAY